MPDTTLQNQSVQVPRTHMTWDDPNGGASGSFTFDLVVTELHERDSQVADHPVESGINITDHTRPDPDHVTLDVFVSQSPLNVEGSQLEHVVLNLPAQPIPLALNGVPWAGASSGPVTVNAQVWTMPSAGKNYVVDAYSLFTWLRDNAILITLITPAAYYQNMLLKKITKRRDKGTGIGASFALEFREVRIVSTTLTDAPKPSQPTADVEKDKGVVTPTTPKKSVAATIGDYANGTAQ